ncbi:MAG: hypothetical protein CTY36_10230 [Methylocystis sp.]|nr:MAG: hypothetical protein CTY36_10230 [Methylocystis sp.]
MSICFFCSSALPLPETREKIVDAKMRFHDVLRHFWISDGRELAQNDREEAAAHGFNALSGFMIQWNKEEGSELISQIPRIIYDTFGRDNVLVYDNDYDLIPY